MKALLKAAFQSKSHLRWLLYSFIALIGMTVSNQLEMFTLGLVIKAGSSHAMFAKISSFVGVTSYNLQTVALVLVFVSIIKGGCLFLSRYTTRVLAIKVSRDLRQQYFEHIQKMSMQFYQIYDIGALSSRVVGDATQIAISINSWITNYLQTPVVVIASLGACFYLSWKLSLVIFVGVPLIIIPVRWITRRVKRITRSIQANQERFTSVLIDFLAGVQTVKVFSMESYLSRKYREQNDGMERLEMRAGIYDLMTRPILHFVTMTCLVGILLVGLYGMHMELAELVVFCGVLHLFYEPIRKFADENASVQRGVVAAERLFEVLHREPAIQDHKNAIPLTAFKEEIVFDRVWFRYEEEWVLKGVSFTIKKGETVAIVGATGSGKSTVLQLIPRLYEVTQGTIFIDGLPLHAYTQQSLRDTISYVPQRPFLFNDTIRDNICYGQEVPESVLEEAARKSYADEFIDALPKRYETRVTDMGKNFSGGQQQRLAIMRAIVKGSPILMLDEATSSLDVLSEQKVKGAIEGLQGEKTQIIVAHRFSTIEHADKIIFLERGEKIAEGTREELLQRCDAFKAMWDASFSSVDQEITAS